MSKHGFSRREFMRSSAGAGIALAVPPFLLNPEDASATPPPSGDRVRFGMIGIGMEGSGVLETSIGLPGVECVAACDVYDGRHTLANEIISGATGKMVPTTRRYQDLLDNKDIDAVVVAVPDHWHAKIIVDACNAGKDVYCEKPMTHKVEEGFEIIEAAQKNDRIVQIGSQRRSSIHFAKAKELIGQGAIGDVWFVEALLGRNSPCGAWVYPPPPDLSPQNLDWETWLGDAPKRAFDPVRFARWRAYEDYGEGLPGDLYVHSLTGIHYVMGLHAPPQRAQTYGGLYYWKDGRDFPDLMTTLYEYPNLQVAVLMTQMTDVTEVTRFLGTRGIIEVYGDGDRLTIARQDGKDHDPCYYIYSYPGKMRSAYEKEWHKKNDPRLGTSKPVEAQESYNYPPGYSEFRHHLWNFFESVRTRQPSVEDAVFGNNTSIGCHMANYSTSTSPPRSGTQPEGPSRLRGHDVGRRLKRAPLLSDCPRKAIRNHCSFSVSTSGRATSQVRVITATALFLTRHDHVYAEQLTERGGSWGERALYWAPRALGIAFALFISVFALDVFEENLPLAKLLSALAVHLIPTGIIVVVLALAWKREWLGFVGFVALGLVYMWTTRLRFDVIAYLIISGPAFLIGLLFLANWRWRRKSQ